MADCDDHDDHDAVVSYKGPSEKYAPKVRDALMTMASDPDIVDFLEACAAGVPKYLAGASVGWSPAQVNARLKDPSFRSLYDGADDLALDGVELAMINKARLGHVAAAQFVLTNRRPDKWAEKRQLEVKTTIGVNDADKANIMEGVREMMKNEATRTEAIRALQTGAIDAHAEQVDRAS